MQALYLLQRCGMALDPLPTWQTLPPKEPSLKPLPPKEQRRISQAMHLWLCYLVLILILSLTSVSSWFPTIYYELQLLDTHREAGV
jgi:hypothetical protein